MFRFCSLYSGSSGNCLLVKTDTTQILIDCGESAKKITTALTEVESNIENIDAILITHEHIDHIKSLGTLSKKYNIPIYANIETLNAIPDKIQYNQENVHIFNNSTDFSIGDLTIHPFSVPHDAANPCGFNISHKDKTMSIATDIGHINPHIISNLEKSSFILLEANYEPSILKCSPYPYYLKERISGPYGHLSNENAAETIAHLQKNNLKSVMLGHLSKENNFPELAYQTVMDELLKHQNIQENFDLNIATRFQPSKIIDI